MAALIPIAEAGLSAAGGYLAGRGTAKLKGAAQGSGYWLQNQGNIINAFGGQGTPFAWPEISQFSDWLNQLTSPIPTARMTAAAPQITGITQQTQDYEQQLANLPPGGAKEFLQAQGYQKQSGAIANLLAEEFANAEKEKGTLGQWTVGTMLKSFGEAAGVEQAAGGLLTDLIYPSAAGAAGTQTALNSILQKIMQAIPTGGSTSTGGSTLDAGATLDTAGTGFYE